MIVTIKLCQGTLVQSLGQMRCLIGEVVNCKHAACGEPVLPEPDLICLPCEQQCVKDVKEAVHTGWVYL